MSRGGRQLGPKKGARRNAERKEIRRSERMAARLKKKENDMVETRWERLHDKGSARDEFISGGLREDVPDVYSAPREEEKCVFTL